MSSLLSNYGGRFLPITSIESIRDNFEEGKTVRAAGRLMARRIMGKSTFCDLKDESARMQIYGKQGDGDFSDEIYKQFTSLSIGDIIGIEGILFTSKSGEKTIRIQKFERLSSIIRTLPEKWHGLKDVEARYRHRYVDLIVNDEVRAVFKKRSKIIRWIREFLDQKGYMEVETPMMQPIPGGARARPFVTHHNSLHMDLYLRVAPELYLKRLLVGGFEKVYEINRNFRNEGISTRHNPEFTMLELYEAYADYNDMMDITESLITDMVQRLYAKEEIVYQDKILNFKRPWKRISFYESLKEKTGFDLLTANVRDAARKFHIDCSPEREEIDILNDLFGETVEKDLWDPTFVIDYPTAMTPLAKGKEDDPRVCYRFEMFIAGMEIANAFSELNDPTVQRERLDAQREMIGEHKELDEDFLMALEYGMPSAGGLGIGIDRLVMILTGQNSIRDVILFPQLKPQKTETIAATSPENEPGESS